jgi:mono/diheme cytochrome c family protein
MKVRFLRILVLFFLSVFVVSCSHYDEINADIEESESGDDESHKAGQNCGSCHNSAGHEAVREGGWWTVSGTVFTTAGKAQKNAVIELWEKPNKQGKLVKRLVVDDLGNFYTNQILPLSAGVYPTITVGSNSLSMTQAFVGGSCNSCHGVSRSSLQIN